MLISVWRYRQIPLGVEMKALKRTAVALLGFGLAAATSLAQAVTIDFETTAIATYNSLTIGEATITYTGGDGDFQVVFASPGAPISGRAIISVFDNPGPAPFRVDFSSLVSSVSIGVGDFDADVDNTFMQAYDSSNNLLDSDSYVNPAPTFGGDFLTVSAASIAYVLFWDAEPFPGAVYWDQLSYQQVPEPNALLLAALALGGLGLTLRRKA